MLSNSNKRPHLSSPLLLFVSTPPPFLCFPSSSFAFAMASFSAMEFIVEMEKVLLFLGAFAGCMILLYLLETYLGLRQHLALRSPILPAALKGVTSQEEFMRCRSYMVDRSHIRLVREATNMVFDCMILLQGWLPWLWKRSEDFVTVLGYRADNEILQSLAFLAAILICSQVLELPFSLYSTFVIETRHGFNKLTLRQYFMEFFMRMCLCGLFGAPVAALAIIIAQRGGPSLAFYLWIFSAGASIALLTIYPVLIAPLFNNFLPILAISSSFSLFWLYLHCGKKLPAGKLKEKIEDLALSLNFPLDKIFLSDGSKRSTHSSAYMYGVFSKNIVLDDTLIKQCKNADEIVAIIAHEMGHWKLNHTTYAWIGSQVCALVQFGLLGYVVQSSDLYLSFGFEKQPFVIGFLIFQHVVLPVQRLLMLVINILSRSSEFKADIFAKRLGYGNALRASLLKLQEQSLSSANVDSWYSAYHCSHPSFAERLAALKELDNSI